MENMDKMKALLAEECLYQLSDEVMDEFLGQMDTIELKNKQVLIEEGTVNRDIYIVKSGIIAQTYLDGKNERVWGFSQSGTLFYSNMSYYMGEPSFYRIVACCDAEVLHLSKQKFDNMIKNSHEFAQWALSMAQCQLYFYDHKNDVINGDSDERFIGLLQNRPEILRTVSSKLLASYLGVTPQYLCRLKKKHLF